MFPWIGQVGLSQAGVDNIDKWSMVPPIAGKLIFSARQHSPSDPQAAEPRMPYSMCSSIVSVMGETENAPLMNPLICIISYQ